MNFTFSNLASYFAEAINQGYQVMTCQEYANSKLKLANKPNKILINRVDIDVSVKKAKRIVDIFNQLNLKASFFVRLHANEYNPFSFENYKILRFIRDSGHEIGYHSEVIDQSVIWNEPAEDCLRRDIALLNQLLDINIVGVASHGGMTGLNNLDFWKDKVPSDFGLLYEAYDRQPAFDAFHTSFYISDSNWTYWKCYKKGILCEKDNRTLGEQLRENHSLVYSTIHPETYYDEHFYE